ncbi:MAG: hypothetical protein ABSC03_00290 [Verrucomicrobiota bacterium]|jgi:hypothetical protein
MKYTVLLIVLLIAVTGCGKPKPKSTRLQPYIDLCQNILLSLPLPQDAEVDGMQKTFSNWYEAVSAAFPKGSKEYNTIYPVVEQYMSYIACVKIGRESLADTVRILGPTMTAEELKQKRDESYASMLQQYNLTREKARDAATILEKIQSED